MSWFSRYSWCEGPFNSGNCRHWTNVSFGDEPVYDSNPNSYNQSLDFSNPLPHYNYQTDSRSDTRAAFQAEFTKLQQNFEQFMDQQSCSYCGGPFNGGNCPTFMTNHHSAMSRHTRASYVGTILTMVIDMC
nr:hypothetical protein [Tanacetum cinerariifolium]